MTSPVILEPENQWVLKAMCQGDDARHWEVGVGDNQYAKSMCLEMCPVREQCLAKALAQRPRIDGLILGGITFFGVKGHACERCGDEVVFNDRNKICEVCVRSWRCPMCDRSFYNPGYPYRRLYCSRSCRMDDAAKAIANGDADIQDDEDEVEYAA